MGGTVTSIVLFIYMVLQMFFTWIIFTYHRFLSECDNSAPVQSVQFKSSHSIKYALLFNEIAIAFFLSLTYGRSYRPSEF